MAEDGPFRLGSIAGAFVRIIPAPSTLTALKRAGASLRRRKKLAIAGTLVLGGLLLAAMLRRDQPRNSGGMADRPAPATNRASGDATLPVAIDDDEPTLFFGGAGGLGRRPSAENDERDHPPQLPRLSARIDEDAELTGAATRNAFSPAKDGKFGRTGRAALDGGADAWRPSSRVGIWQQFDSAPTRGAASREWPSDEVAGGPLNSEAADRAPAAVPPDDLADDGIEDADHEFPGAARGMVVHRIRDGDTLSGLARRYLGSRERYWEIYDANRDRLKDPDLLPIGVDLHIPIASVGSGKPSMLPVGQRVPPHDR